MMTLDHAALTAIRGGFVDPCFSLQDVKLMQSSPEQLALAKRCGLAFPSKELEREVDQRQYFTAD
jgi:hypothetical protein